MHIFSFSGEAVGEKKNENNIFFEQARSGKDLLLWPNDDNEKQLNLKLTKYLCVCFSVCSKRILVVFCDSVSGEDSRETFFS